MDFLAELEGMVSNATSLSFSEVPQREIDRWQRLFDFSVSEAASAIETYRLDLSRSHISDDLWTLVAAELEAQGHDRESYEYSLTLPRRHTPVQSIISSTSVGKPPSANSFIIKLEGPIYTVSKIQAIASLSCPPTISKGEGASHATFCEIDGAALQRVLTYLSLHHPSFRPTVVRLAKAAKLLSPTSIAPTLGVESTLPQHRLGDESAEARPLTPTPAQDEFPMWYFFYGSLCQPEVLSKHVPFRKDDRPLIPGYICGGRVRMWGGKYKALIDDTSSFSGASTAVRGRVDGHAFRVRTREEEDALRFYEGEKYEVVRCEILFKDMGGVESQSAVGKGSSVTGLTFRFAGTERDLD